MNFQTLLPLFARDTLSMGAEGYGALFAVMGAGSLVGSLSLAFAGSRRPMLALMLGGAVSFVAFELILGLTRDPAVAYPLILVIGFSSMVMVNTINVMIQNSVSHELRGRVMSLYVTVFAGSAPIGGFFAGAVAEVWGAPAGFLLGATISVRRSSAWSAGSWCCATGSGANAGAEALHRGHSRDDLPSRPRRQPASAARSAQGGRGSAAAPAAHPAPSPPPPAVSPGSGSISSFAAPPAGRAAWPPPGGGRLA